MKDPYQVLSVSQTASPGELKSAYRNLAKELHPDVNPGDTIVEQRFKEITAAYDLLSDPKKRRQYDQREINSDGSPRFEQGNAQRGGQGGAASAAALPPPPLRPRVAAPRPTRRAARAPGRGSAARRAGRARRARRATRPSTGARGTCGINWGVLWNVFELWQEIA